MRVAGRLRGVLAGLFVSAFFLCTFGERAESQSNPTPEQLQIFQGLTPEQQQSIRSALGAATGLSQGYGSYGAGQRPASSLTDSERLRRERMRTEGGDEEVEPLIPVLKREDWVIIEIDYQLPPRPIPPYLQALYSSTAQTGPGSAAVATQSVASSAQAAATQIAAQTGVPTS